jgi:hypothetical protein
MLHSRHILPVLPVLRVLHVSCPLRALPALCPWREAHGGSAQGRQVDGVQRRSTRL